MGSTEGLMPVWGGLVSSIADSISGLPSIRQEWPRRLPALDLVHTVLASQNLS
jgi:hypothetical protein